MRSNETAVFIDGPNVYATAKALRVDTDWALVLKHYEQNSELIRIAYYTAIRERREGENDPIRPLLDYLEYNGYAVVTKPTKEWADPHGGKPKIKGNMDIEMAVDAMEVSEHIRHAVFFTGDGDFTSVLFALQRKGVRCTVISSTETQPPMCSDELRRAADKFVELSEFVKLITLPDPKRSQYA